MKIWAEVCGGHYEINRIGAIRRLKPARGTYVGKYIEPWYPSASQDEAYVTICCGKGRIRQVKVSVLMKEAWGE